MGFALIAKKWHYTKFAIEPSHPVSLYKALKSKTTSQLEELVD
jgi:hypothetical protein|tara:strand:+ start:278 stop:406 length:129 start_codon:yes stop_codon:yes gene_type:complete